MSALIWPFRDANMCRALAPLDHAKGPEYSANSGSVHSPLCPSLREMDLRSSEKIEPRMGIKPYQCSEGPESSGFSALVGISRRSPVSDTRQMDAFLDRAFQ